MPNSGRHPQVARAWSVRPAQSNGRRSLARGSPMGRVRGVFSWGFPLGYGGRGQSLMTAMRMPVMVTNVPIIQRK